MNFRFNDSTILNYTQAEYYGNSPDIGAFENWNVVSIPEYILDNEILIYPTPTTTEQITINSEYLTFKSIEIVDIHGKIVYSDKTSCSKTTVDLAHIKSGIYFLILNTSSKKYSEIIIKE